MQLIRKGSKKIAERLAKLDPGYAKWAAAKATVDKLYDIYNTTASAAKAKLAIDKDAAAKLKNNEAKYSMAMQRADLTYAMTT